MTDDVTAGMIIITLYFTEGAKEYRGEKISIECH